MYQLCALGQNNAIRVICNLDELSLSLHKENIKYKDELFIVYCATNEIDKRFFAINDMIEGYKADEVSTAQLSNDINGLINDFLSAVRVYQDSFEHTLSQLFGKKSKLFCLFHEEKAKAFDSSFSYKFCEQIRNYCQHRAVIVEKINYTMNDGEKNVQLLISSSTVLKDEKFKIFIEKHVPNFIIQYPDYVNLFDNITIYYGILKNINHLLVLAFYDANKIFQILDKERLLSDDDLDLIIFDLIEQNKPEIKLNDLNYYRIKDLKKMINAILGVNNMLLSAMNYRSV